MSDTDKSWPSLKARLIITTTGADCPAQLRQIVRRRHGPGVSYLWRIELRARWKSVGALSRVSSATRCSGCLFAAFCRASFDRGFQGCRKARHGPDCDDVRPRPRPADCVGKGFLRYAENRSLTCPPIACHSIVFWLTTAADKGATLTTGRASCDGDGYSMAYP
jgi:hypothetical protein